MNGNWRLTILHACGSQSDYDFSTYALCLAQVHQYVKENWATIGPPADMPHSVTNAIDMYFDAADEQEAYRIIQPELLEEIEVQEE